MSLDEKTERALRVLLDKQEIHEVLMRYCRGIDRCDAELLQSVYHPDSTDDHGLFKGRAADFIPWALKALVRDDGTSHYIANELIEVDGDVAHCESYFSAYIAARRRTAARLIWSSPEDTRTALSAAPAPGRLRIARWSSIEAGSTKSKGCFRTEGLVCGRRSREDPAYKR